MPKKTDSYNFCYPYVQQKFSMLFMLAITNKCQSDLRDPKLGNKQKNRKKNRKMVHLGNNFVHLFVEGAV